MNRICFERCQHHLSGSPINLTVAQGEAGEGVYAYVPSEAMRQYYSANGESVFSLKLIAGEIIDFKGDKLIDLVQYITTETKHFGAQVQGYVVPKIHRRNVQRFGWWISAYMSSRHPDAVAYIVPHCGPGIPTGRQVVVTSIANFEVLQIF